MDRNDTRYLPKTAARYLVLKMLDFPVALPKVFKEIVGGQRGLRLRGQLLSGVLLPELFLYRRMKALGSCSQP